MRLERFKIENLIPSSVLGMGLPYLKFPNSSEILQGADGKFEGKNTITVADKFSGINGNGATGLDIRELDKTSALGYAFTMPVGFKLNGELIQLPWEPIVGISSSKTIVQTPLAGNTRRGSVIEIINSENYDITIAGHCYDHTHTSYPEDQVEKLKKLDNYTGSIEIISALTDLFDISNVVITKLNLPAMQGKPYVQNYTMQLISDEDFLLIQD